MTDTSETNQAAEPTPGQQLKAARIKAGISLEDAAKALFMTRHKLSALEEDDFDRLPSAVFVQGYIRKYADYLKLDAEILVEQYVSVHKPVLESDIDESNVVPRTPINVKEQRSKSWLPLSGVAIAVAIGIGVAINSGNDKPRLQSTNQSTDEVRIDAALNAAQSSDAVEKSSTVTEPEIVTEPETVTTAVELPAATSTKAPVPAAVPSVETARPQAAQTVESVNAVTETESVGARAASASNAFNQMQSTGSTGIDQLALAFLEDCWVEVSDASGKVIHADLANAGDSFALAGEAPFSLMLGNARGVSVSLNGDVVAVEPRPGHRTHRMVVGE